MKITFLDAALQLQEIVGPEGRIHNKGAIKTVADLIRKFQEDYNDHRVHLVVGETGIYSYDTAGFGRKLQLFKIVETARTPYGDECIIPDEKTTEIIMAQTRGCYQDTVARNLCTQGYVVGYTVDGDILKGNAGRYKGCYAKSVESLMDRIIEERPTGLYLVSGEVGSNGEFGYYLSA